MICGSTYVTNTLPLSHSLYLRFCLSVFVTLKVDRCNELLLMVMMKNYLHSQNEIAQFDVVVCFLKTLASQKLLVLRVCQYRNFYIRLYHIHVLCQYHMLEVSCRPLQDTSRQQVQEISLVF